MSEQCRPVSMRMNKWLCVSHFHARELACLLNEEDVHDVLHWMTFYRYTTTIYSYAVPRPRSNATSMA